MKTMPTPLTRLEKTKLGHLRRIAREKAILLDIIRLTGRVPLRNVKRDIVAYSEVDKDDAELISNVSGRWSLVNGYAECGKTKLHRLIVNAKHGEEVDHRNGNKLDNRKSELRVCSHSGNMTNQPKYKGDFKSKYKGVSIANSETWRARITVNKVTILIGCFPTEQEAAYAYDVAAKKYHGDFANLNNVSPCVLHKTYKAGRQVRWNAEQNIA